MKVYFFHFPSHCYTARQPSLTQLPLLPFLVSLFWLWIACVFVCKRRRRKRGELRRKEGAKLFMDNYFHIFYGHKFNFSQNFTFSLCILSTPLCHPTIYVYTWMGLNSIWRHVKALFLAFNFDRHNLNLITTSKGGLKEENRYF
jgi:hypothetical protein